MRAVLVLMMLAACGDKDGESPATDDSEVVDPGDDTGEVGDDTGDDTAVDTAADAPTLTACDAECYLSDIGDPVWQWQVRCTASDPQGAANITNGRLDVLRNGGVVYSDLVACSALGECTASFQEANSGVLCADATQYRFRVWVSDEEGHESAPFEVTGRQR